MSSAVAIVDYGMGNLFSVSKACEAVGLEAVVTSSPREVLAASAAIIPGVGAFGDAMRTLEALGLADAIRELAAAGRPIVGICLGLQLLLSESEEFGHHAGLGLIPGRVVPLPRGIRHMGRALKIPNVGWARISPVRPWTGTLLEQVSAGEYMYFTHSYWVEPQDPSTVLALSSYGNVEFPCSLSCGSLFGTQFHPERSGPEGLAVYRSLAGRIGAATSG